MTLAALSLFLLELAAGTALLLVFVPHRGPLGRGFFALHGFIALLAIGLVFLLRPSGFEPRLAAAAGTLLALYTLFARVRRQRQWLPALALAAAALAVQLARVSSALVGVGEKGWAVAATVLGALLLGCVLLTMNLGHWYLVSRSLPFTYLFNAATAYTVFASLRALLLGMAMLWCPNRAGLERLLSLEQDALFFLLRVLWGIIGPVALSYFVWQTAKIRSNQAATGLLYVALVFVVIGELLASYLTVATKFPV